jgi:hypothetical protein
VPEDRRVASDINIKQFTFNPWFCRKMNPIIYRGDILLKSQKDNSTTYYFIGSQEGDTD